ncbi:MAG: nitric oxide reductase activation protein NorD [Pseudomonas sp.]
MAEAEDLISDAARHATVYAQNLWRRHRTAVGAPTPVALADVAHRLDLLIVAAFGSTYRLRIAQPPSPPTLLQQVFRRAERPRLQGAIPATDDTQIWLPAHLGIDVYPLALERYRTLALQQAMRAQRGSARQALALIEPLPRSLYLLLEAWAADAELARRLPGMAAPINVLRQQALAARPALQQFSALRQPLEQFLRRLLHSACGQPLVDLSIPATAADSIASAVRLAARLLPSGQARALGPQPLLLDCWTGELRVPLAPGAMPAPGAEACADTENTPRSARLARRPEVRQARPDEDEEAPPGIWMIQPAQPQEHIEDPMGLQRPTDRDQATPAEDFADSLAELNEARLVMAPGSPKEVLLSDDPPDSQAARNSQPPERSAASITYPEWDYRIAAYRDPGVRVHLLSAPLGPQQWVEQTLHTHRSMLATIRRQFELLRARPARRRQQLEGDELDLEAYIDAVAQARAGLSMPQALYQTQRRDNRDLAIMLLVDASGSTDGWLSCQRRIIDVEREALLLVCLALEGLGQPYCVQAFSGEGPQWVTLRTLKGFAEGYGTDIGQRIAGLEPERYTRAGAAIRHASAELMNQPAAHRLLLLLSDGKPNDVDDYQGRYGVEDLRQAINEAKLQGIQPFCLTIDRHAADYLPRVFGAHHYALLATPERLPGVLLEWLKRLVST